MKEKGVENENVSPKKNIYVVLGVARSGTSVIARGLNVLGVDLGTNLTPADDTWNPKGFWEDRDISYSINRRILRTLNYKKECVKLIEESQLASGALQKLRQRATLLLQQRFESLQHWGFKDPRTARVLSFWQSIFQSLNLNDNYIIVLRNPLASAASYQKLKRFDLEVGLLFWLMHLIPAIEGTHDKKRLVVNYECMLENPRYQLERINKGLNLPFAWDEGKVEAYVNDFLDKKYNRFEQSYDAFKSSSAITVVPLCLKTYDLLLKLAKDELSFEDPLFATTWREIKAEFEKVYPLYSYVDKLLQNKIEVDKKLRKIEGSLWWKIVYPYRKIQDMLRTCRQKRKDHEVIENQI